MKIALVSMDQVWEDKEANKVRCRQFIERAAKDRADLIVFPEMKVLKGMIFLFSAMNPS